MNHLDSYQLALLSRGDLPFSPALQARLHCLVCSDCRHELAEFKKTPELAKLATLDFDLPRHLDWDTLQSEMTANIHLGLEIGQIASRVEAASATPAESAPELDWKRWVSVAALSACVLTGWFLSGPANHQNRFTPSHTAAQVQGFESNISADESGLGLQQKANRSSLILRASNPANTRLEVGLEGSVRAATVDQDSGQITVSQIYVD